jgi:outer membrane receptor protein involved in Fe transport
LVGGYYTNEDGLILQDFIAATPGTTTPIAGLPLLGRARVDSKYKELAGFANGTVHVVSWFDLDLGGRYSHNKQHAHQVSDGVLAGGFNDFPVAHSSENVFTYSVAPKFKPNKDTTIYGRVAKGFRPGGPNVLPPGPHVGVPETYGSDSVVSWEVGYKGETSDHRFSIDAAAFHINWKDIQLFANVNGFGVNVNGSSARSNGFEFTAAAHPVAGFDISLNGTYNNAQLTGDTPSVVGGRNGDALPFTPKLSFGLNSSYQWQLGTGLGARVGGSWRHVSSQTADYDAAFVAAHGHQRRVDPYEVIDLNAGLSFGRFDLDAYVKNLNNSHGVTSTTGTVVFGAFPLFPGGAIGTGIIRSRTVGLTLGAHY